LGEPPNAGLRREKTCRDRWGEGPNRREKSVERKDDPLKKEEGLPPRKQKDTLEKYGLILGHLAFTWACEKGRERKVKKFSN